MVALVVMDILYIQYSFSRKRFNFSWPITILRTVMSLGSTIFFIPLLGLFMSILSCRHTVHIYFQELQCWTGIHLLHSIIGFATALVFLLICCAYTMVMFERRGSLGESLSKINSRQEIYYLCGLGIQTFSVSVLNTEDEQWTLVLVLLISSMIVFLKYHYCDAFFNINVLLSWKLSTGI